MIKREAAQTAWEGHSFQALVEITTKLQALQTTWKVHAYQVLVEAISKRQALQTTWEGHPLKGLVESITKRQAFQTAWESHVIQILVEPITKCQTLQTAWGGHMFQALVELMAKRQALEGFWEAVEVLAGCSTFYARDPFQFKRIVYASLSLNEGPCSIQICWAEGVCQCCFLIHNTLLLQGLFEHQLRNAMMEKKLCTRL